MLNIKQLLFIVISFFLYTNLIAQEAPEFDFDAMENAMVETGLDQTIQTHVPSRLEMALRRIADPILYFFLRSYNYVKERYTRTITALKRVFNRRFRQTEENENNAPQQA